ncbi:hypothetical protein WJX72_002310 [[Myrmecia] bisecta]|uniref:JmjC domain-containing protein n=1 Tax=[Myrmecia] bisecta TaxID=41462 RepID=A0AAW1P4S2_9CHLO
MRRVYVTGWPERSGVYPYDGKIVLDLNEFLEGIHPDELARFRANNVERQRGGKAAAAAAVKGGKYVSFNYQPKPGTDPYPGLAMERSVEDAFIRSAGVGVTDDTRTVLVLIGGARVWTRFHVDWTEAHNTAWGLDGRALGVGPDGRMRVRIVRRFEGQQVIVAPGWMHVVFNQRPCIKIAYDFWRPANFQLYMRLWRELSVLTDAAPDYMAAAVVMVKAIAYITALRGLPAAMRPLPSLP